MSNQPVGLAMVNRWPDNGGPRGYSIALLVHPAHRGLGYGGEIMAATIAATATLGRDVWVGTDRSNAGMVRIMHTLGYQADGRYPTARLAGVDVPACWYHVHHELPQPESPAA